MKKIKGFDEEAEEFEREIKKEAPDVVVERKKIHYTDRQYIVKVPRAIMKEIDHKDGGCLVFTLTKTVQNGDVKKKLKIEYEHAKEKK